MTDKLKIVLDDLKTRIKIAESKIELQDSRLEGQQNELIKLKEKKDSTENVKQNQLQFAENYNNTMKNFHIQIDTIKADNTAQHALQDEKRNDLKIHLDKKLQELDAKIDTINKTLDF